MDNWPPKPYDSLFTKVNEHDAWLTGDPEQLAKVYGGQSGATGTRGVFGAVKEFFWGKPVDSKKKTRIHVPLAADIATASADLLFSEPPRYQLPKQDNAGTKDHPAQARLDELMGAPETQAVLLEAAEFAAAHGGVFLRVVWDAELTDRPFIVAVPADGAIPTFQFGRLRSVKFWVVVSSEGNSVLRHVETHTAGKIRHELYAGTTSTLGRPVPLADSPATAWLANLVNSESEIVTGATGLTAVYVPNRLPQRRWRKILELAPIGRSDFDGVEAVFDSIDEVMSSWLRDIRLAKARVFVDQNLMENNGLGQGATFDAEQELFTALPAGAGSMAADKPLDVHQFAIRVAEHQSTVHELTRVALRGAGYSPASLGEETTGGAQETATQVRARHRLSERTRDKKIGHWRPALSHLARTLLEVDGLVFGGNKYDGAKIDTVFADKSQTDILELAETVSAVNSAQAASTETKVRMLHPEWENAAVSDEVARIMSESSMSDPFTDRGLNGGETPDPEDPEQE